MQAIRSHLALLLLLCLVRTVLPEAWILALHPHSHTTEEPAQAPAFRYKGKALISAKHQHCDVEQFYNVAFQAAVPVAAPQARGARGYAATPPLPPVRPAAGEALFARSLRGPPRRA